MPRRKRLLIDVDEVLADFQTPVFALADRLLGKRFTPYDFDNWDIFSVFNNVEREALFTEMGKPGFCLDFPVVAGSLEAVREMQESMDVYAVTNPFPRGTWVTDRNTWLQEKFGFERTHIVHTSAKFLVTGDAILDDNPVHIVDWLGEHPKGLGMLWHIPNTRTMTHYDHLRVKSWNEVLRNLRALVEGQDGSEIPR